MNIFDDEAIEALARKIAVAAGRMEHDWAVFRHHAKAGITAAENSLIARDKLHYEVRKGTGPTATTFSPVPFAVIRL